MKTTDNQLLEQERVIKDLEIELFNSEYQFKLAFTTIQLLPTPVYVLLPYCRKYNSFLSLMSLLSISMSIYILQIFTLSIPWLGIELPDLFSTTSQSQTKRTKIGLTARTPLEKYLTPLNIVLAGVILLTGYVEHSPWRGYDYVWILPIVSIFMTVLLRKWIAETHGVLSGLKQSQYAYKGA